MAGTVSNTLASYVSNPVSDYVLVATIACTAVGVWTGVGTIPCTALYYSVLKTAVKSAIVGTLNTVVDQSSLSTTDKT